MLSRSEANLLHGLQRRKSRETEGLFLAEGVRVAEELVRSGIDLRLAVVSTSLEDSERGRALAGALRARTTVHEVGEAEMRKLAATDAPQGVVIAAATPSSRIAHVQPGARAFLLVADAVQDPGNLGTLIRIGDAFGALAIVALTGTVDPWNPKVVRAAAGSSFHLPVVTAASNELAEWMTAHAVTGVAGALSGTDVGAYQPAARTALLVGNEGGGLRAETLPLARDAVTIPMRGNAESLNVAIAAGILSYELTRRME